MGAMKKKILLGLFVLAVLLLVLAIIWEFNRSSSAVVITAVDQTVMRESDAIQSCVERRCQDLDRKLDRIEGKLDRLLKIAERPLPDGMQEAK